MQLLRKEMDTLFEKFFSGEEWPADGRWMPAVDVAENDKQVTVKVEVPGVDPKDIDVSLEGNYLTVRGEKKSEREEKGENFHRVERSFGSFSRTIELPQNIDSNEVTAENRNGVLAITIAKLEGTTPRKIAVKGA
jgi:HSP20 family protein